MILSLRPVLSLLNNQAILQVSLSFCNTFHHLICTSYFSFELILNNLDDALNTLEMPSFCFHLLSAINLHKKREMAGECHLSTERRPSSWQVEITSASSNIYCLIIAYRSFFIALRENNEM